MADYVKEYGSAALSVPPNQGGLQAIYLVPGLIALGAAGLVIMTVRRWKRQGKAQAALAPAAGENGSGPPDDYDRKLDEELKGLDG